MIRGTDLCKIIQEKTGLPIKKVTEAVRLTVKELGLGVQRDGVVQIQGFGTFYKWYFKGQMESIFGYIAPGWKVRFRASQVLRETTNHEREVPPVPGLRSRDYSSECKR